jgi:hypothetical protein
MSRIPARGTPHACVCYTFPPNTRVGDGGGGGFLFNLTLWRKEEQGGTPKTETRQKHEKGVFQTSTGTSYS